VPAEKASAAAEASAARTVFSIDSFRLEKSALCGISGNPGLNERRKARGGEKCHVGVIGLAARLHLAELGLRGCLMRLGHLHAGADAPCQSRLRSGIRIVREAHLVDHLLVRSRESDVGDFDFRPSERWQAV
jgi:hypothetical protein